MPRSSAVAVQILRKAAASIGVDQRFLEDVFKYESWITTAGQDSRLHDFGNILNGAPIPKVQRLSRVITTYRELSFDGKLREECQYGEIFYSLKEAQIVIKGWRKQYNTVRPHSAIALFGTQFHSPRL